MLVGRPTNHEDPLAHIIRGRAGRPQVIVVPDKSMQCVGRLWAAYSADVAGHQDSGAPSGRSPRTRHQRLFNVVALGAQGLLIGVTSLAAAALTVVVIGATARQDRAQCVDDLACLPHLGPAILAMLAMPVVMAVVGPLVAMLLHLSSPGLFATPVLWTVVAADLQDHWLFNSLTSTISIFLVSYALLAVWLGSDRTARNSG
jgi:hypothetical protein